MKHGTILITSLGIGHNTRSTRWLFLQKLNSNGFMTMAWYGHLKHLNDKPLAVAVLVSWGITLFEYMLQVPDALGIQDTVWPVALLPIGYAAETPASTARRVLQEIVGNLSGIPHF